MDEKRLVLRIQIGVELDGFTGTKAAVKECQK
jgi:hypothetical protein